MFFSSEKTSSFFCNEYVVCKEESVYDAILCEDVPHEKWLTLETTKHFTNIDYRVRRGHTVNQEELNKLHENIDSQVGQIVKSKIFFPTLFRKNPASVSDTWIDEKLNGIPIQDPIYEQDWDLDPPAILFKPKVSAHLIVAIDKTSKNQNVCFCILYPRRLKNQGDYYSVYTFEQSDLLISMKKEDMTNLPNDFLLISNNMLVSKEGNESEFIKFTDLLTDFELGFDKKTEPNKFKSVINSIWRIASESKINSGSNFFKNGHFSFLNRENSRDLFLILKNDLFQIIAICDILIELSALNKKLNMIACLFLFFGVLPGIIFWIYKDNLLNKKMSNYISKFQHGISSSCVNNYTTGVISAK